jgi:hypothetical protein
MSRTGRETAETTHGGVPEAPRRRISGPIRRGVPDSTYRRVMRCGMNAHIAGVLVLSVVLFNRIPIVLTLALSVGALLIAAGLLAWLWGFIWGRG